MYARYVKGKKQRNRNKLTKILEDEFLVFPFFTFFYTACYTTLVKDSGSLGVFFYTACYTTLVKDSGSLGVFFLHCLSEGFRLTWRLLFTLPVLLHCLLHYLSEGFRLTWSLLHCLLHCLSEGFGLTWSLFLHCLLHCLSEGFRLTWSLLFTLPVTLP